MIHNSASSNQKLLNQIDAFGARKRSGVTEHGTTISPQFQYAHNALSSSVTSPRMMTATTTWNSAGNRTGVSNPIVKLTIKLDANGRVMETDQQEDNATFSNFFKYDTLDHQTLLADLVGTLSTYAAARGTATMTPSPDARRPYPDDGIHFAR